MAWGNSANVRLTNINAGSDSPALARPDIHDGFVELQAVIGGRGTTNGVAELDAAGLLPQARLPQLPLGSFATIGAFGSGTWTVPANVTRVRVSVQGAGGGGGYTSAATFAGGADDGGGGGGGGFVVKDFVVVPGSTFSYTIAQGGAGKDNSGDGDGAAATITTATSPASATPASTTIYANGGDKGYGPASSSVGGAGGVSGNSTTPGDTTLEKFVGGAGISGGSRGGAGGSSFSQGGVAGANGTGGGGYAGVYGGGGGFGSGHGNNAFNGSDGFVRFEW